MRYTAQPKCNRKFRESKHKSQLKKKEKKDRWLGDFSLTAITVVDRGDRFKGIYVYICFFLLHLIGVVATGKRKDPVENLGFTKVSRTMILKLQDKDGCIGAICAYEVSSG